MTTEPFVIERVLSAPVSSVWEAITDKEKMKQWYFDIAEFEAKPGFEFSFTGNDQGKIYVHLCKVLEVVPQKKLTYTWTYRDYTGESTVTFELFAEGKNTRLKLTHAGLETFPALPSFARTNFQAGWTELIGSQLPNFLARQAQA